MAGEYEAGKSRATELFERIESLGVEALKALYQDQKNEELFLDYKRIATVPGNRGLHPDDRANLKKALSGFANADGGVLIWGLGTSKVNGPDRLALPVPYSDAAGFAGLVDDAISGCTFPPVPGVRSIPVRESSGPEGFVATLIPASPHVPHQTADDQRAYYMRVGSSFGHVPHNVLAGLFGRPPRPTIFLNLAVEPINIERTRVEGVSVTSSFTLTFSAMCVNNSGVVARDAYVSWVAVSLPGERCDLRFSSQLSQWWTTDAISPRMGSCLAKSTNRIAPFSSQIPVTFKLMIRTPIESDLVFDLTTGCEGVPPSVLKIRASKDFLAKEFERLDSPVSHGNIFGEETHELAMQMLGIDSQAVRTA